ncbi:hypothetical protein [Anaerovirgula multivorans]|uniref:hypothetical protein n=1 Tax=Anaerovirgula multivorans TaxID=312168 RepID=UPI00112FDC8C|nr:hypothetical protein [Anaerovirgula multivorans]
MDAAGTPVEVDHRYIGAFLGWIDPQGKLRSLPNKTPRGSITIQAVRDAAKAMGLGWTQLDYYLWRFIQMLYITEYGHPDSQSQIGLGYTSGAASVSTGGTLERGNNTYGSTADAVQVSYRGIEDIYGNLAVMLDGCRSPNGPLDVSNVYFNNGGTGYERISASLSMNLGNIRTIRTEPKSGFIPRTSGLTNTTGGLYDSGRNYSDGYGHVYFYFVGGAYSSGMGAGVFRTLSSRLDLYTSAEVGCRLCL